MQIPLRLGAEQSDLVQEVEVKYRVDDVGSLVEALAGRGVVLGAAVVQDDQAYAPIGWEHGESKIGVPFPRLRTESGRHLFTVKRPIDNELACQEHETWVEDREQMHTALLAMGFYPTVRIVKVRRAGRFADLSLCVDEVRHAGAFLEVERIVPAGSSGEVVQRQLDAFARGLGVPLSRTTDTYDSLIRAALAGT